TGMAALVLGLVATGLATAVEPAPATIRVPSARGSLYSSANWWTRYGEPVNQAAIDAAPAEAVAAPAGWSDYGHGYVYYLGACDYTPPCTDWLWEDYYGMPWRCHHMHHGFGHFGRCGHCGGRFGHCGCGKHDDGCAAPGPDCAAKGPTCEAAPSCEAAPDCGCDVATNCCVKKHFHWHWKKMCFWNKHCGCDTCATECGCDAPKGEIYSSPEQAPPKPSPDMTQKAALVWPFSPVR
ncbi:MAG: hypothetical protein L0211_24040, partial [Planctomycetaceae bacterium]|nr:hypothetical protein [Planctomycetaceae bacterium]